MMENSEYLMNGLLANTVWLHIELIQKELLLKPEKTMI